MVASDWLEFFQVWHTFYLYFCNLSVCLNVILTYFADCHYLWCELCQGAILYYVIIKMLSCSKHQLIPITVNVYESPTDGSVLHVLDFFWENEKKMFDNATSVYRFCFDVSYSNNSVKH